MVQNSPLQNIDKRIANHSTQKIVAKKLKQNQVPQFEIISITGHTREAGLDSCDNKEKFNNNIFEYY